MYALNRLRPKLIALPPVCPTRTRALIADTNLRHMFAITICAIYARELANLHVYCVRETRPNMCQKLMHKTARAKHRALFAATARNANNKSLADVLQYIICARCAQIW